MIYEDEEKYERPSHISYKEYKRNIDSKPNEGIILFVSAFFVLLIIFLGVAKQLSPDVDVSIGDNSEVSVEETIKGNVDGRLRLIQMEDNSGVMEDETFSPELEEKVRIPQQKNKSIMEPEGEVIVLDTSKSVASSSPENTVTEESQTKETAMNSESPVQPAQKIQPSTTSKVIVGYYATAEQAEVAKGIIQEAGLNVQPFVKNIGAAYTLQVGSFSSPEKAQSVANELLKNNFPARIIIE